MLPRGKLVAKRSVQAKDICEHLVCDLVEEDWRLRDLIPRRENGMPSWNPADYPPTIYEELEKRGWPEKLAHYKVARMLEKGILTYTTSYPGRKVDRSKIKGGCQCSE